MDREPRPTVRGGCRMRLGRNAISEKHSGIAARWCSPHKAPFVRYRIDSCVAIMIAMWLMNNRAALPAHDRARKWSVNGWLFDSAVYHYDVCPQLAKYCRVEIAGLGLRLILGAEYFDCSHTPYFGQVLLVGRKDQPLRRDDSAFRMSFDAIVDVNG